MPGRLRLALCAITSAVAFAGCGVGGEERHAREVANLFLGALKHHDGDSACAQLSRDAVKKIVESEQMPCNQAILALKLEGASAGSVRVYVNSARATVAGGDRLYLDRGPNGWKISAAGCQPQPDRQPDDCDLED